MYNGYQAQTNPRSIRVIGADTSPLSMGRVSRATSAFYRLTAPAGSNAQPYIDSLLSIIEREKVDLWISCSGVASAVEDGVARDEIVRVTRGRCKCVQFGEKETEMLHEKGQFMEACQTAGLQIPETHVVKSADEVDAVFAKYYNGMKKNAKPSGIANGDDQRHISTRPEKKRFILKPLLVSDAFRADMTLLPLADATKTHSHLDRLPMNSSTPFILQEFISGPEYCTHSLVVKGKVQSFVACESASILMHYTALPESSPLTQEMLTFTRTMAIRLQNEAETRGEEFTGHLSFDFLVRREGVQRAECGERVEIWPIECNPRTHTAVVLFEGEQGMKMVEDYLKMVGNEMETKKGMDGGAWWAGTGKKTSRKSNGAQKSRTEVDLIYPGKPKRYYWLPHDLVTFVILPLLSLLESFVSSSPPKARSERLRNARSGIQTFLQRIPSREWKDATLDLWDPLPAWWLWHVFWPSKFAESIVKGSRWSAVNVSTGKVFGLE